MSPRTQWLRHLGSPLPAAEDQPDVRDVQVAATERLSAAQGTGATLGAHNTFPAGGFAQTTPVPALRGSTPLVLYTRQIGSPSGESAHGAGRCREMAPRPRLRTSEWRCSPPGPRPAGASP